VPSPNRQRLVILAASLWSASVAAQAPPAASKPAPAATTSVHEAVLTRYCVTCHNERAKTGGLVLDPAELSRIPTGVDGPVAERWEKVAKKLRSASMPPPGMPRPEEATSAALAAAVERALDRAAQARPQIGRVPLAHRLSRTEYRNAIRDLLALDALPSEVSIDYLLPQDNISSGFDNIADLLFVSPSNMERYLDAARKISRIAVGDPAMPAMVNIHQLDEEHPQDERVDALPFGTRGGVAITSDFPVDGTYIVKVDVAGAPREPYQIEVTIDGERAGLQTNDGELSLQLKAGPKLVGVAFVQRTESRDESTLRPRTRSRGTRPALASVTISGPYNVTAPGDSPSRRRIFVCRPATPADEVPCATRIVSTLARRAYRRPVTEADLRTLMPFFQSGRSEGSFERGIQSALERLLVSSQFLFRIERPPSPSARPAPPSRNVSNASNASNVLNVPHSVSDLELASRLSFFLWSSIPDDELLDVAVAGRLKEPRVLERQVRRMLADRRSESMVTNFAAQWLYLRDIDAKVPDEVLFQDFDETLRDALRRETELFIDSVFKENRSVLDLLTADYTFLNERLARHYAIPHVKGSYFRRVTLPAGSKRGGLLGHGSILTITSYANRTSPVLRGKWVLENLLSAAPPPPPADIPALQTSAADSGAALTMREAMARHRASPSCASCHARMDPIGFAMENFDAIGRWRERDGELTIDSTGVFPEGTKFDGVDGLKRELLRHPDLFVHTIAERLLMYAVGRNLQYYDAPTVRAIVRGAAPGKFTLASLVMGVVQSRPFQMRGE
jgi:mono/diheme cytochrome c family protein